MALTLTHIFLFSLIPFGVMVFGGIISTFYEPSEKTTVATQHFAAGVVFAAVAKELLPNLSAHQSPLSLIIGFSLGVLCMLFVKQVTERLSENADGQQGMPFGMLCAVGVDVFIDGLLIGIAFLAGEAGGVLVAVALSIEVLFLGIATSSSMSKRAVHTTTRICIGIGLALLIPIGSLLGGSLFSHMPEAITHGLLAFGIAALLYLVTEELLVEAHEAPLETPIITSCFFLGFLCILLLDGLSK